MQSSEYDSIFQRENDYWWYMGLHELVLHFARHLRRGSLALDAGCGTGRMLELLALGGLEVEGVDISPKAVEYCKRRGLERVEAADLNSWEGPNGCYDAIVSLDAIYHVSIKSDVDVLSRFQRSLRDGGVLILNVTAFECLARGHDVVVGVGKRYRLRPFVKELLEVGFVVDLATYRLPALYLLIRARKLIRSLRGAPEPVESDLGDLPRWLNGLLLQGIRLENLAIRLGAKMPFGSSLFIVAHRGPAPALRAQAQEPRS